MPAQTGSRSAKPDTDIPSDAWVPSAAGDQLVGEVVDIDTGWSDYRNGEYPLLTVRTDDDVELKLHAFRTVLFNEIMKRQPVVGEHIVVTYLGPGKARQGMSPPDLYRVRVEGRSAADARAIYRRVRPEPAAEPDVAVDEPALSFEIPEDDPPF
jgi:hypothetical protein